MAVIGARLLSLDDNAGITLGTDSTLKIAESGTMSGGSRWSARLWAGGRGRRQRSRRGYCAWGQASLHGLLAGWEVSLCVAIDKVGELALPEQGLLTDTA